MRLSLQNDRALLTLQNASPEQLRALLVEARSAARARPVEANSTGAVVHGTLVLSRSQLNEAPTFTSFSAPEGAPAPFGRPGGR